MIRIFSTSIEDSNYDMAITLDGSDYIMRFLWNERDAHWYLTLIDSTGIDIVTGIKIVTDNYSAHCADERMPSGLITFVETTGSDLDPGLRELGTRVKLVYIDEESLP